MAAKVAAKPSSKKAVSASSTKKAAAKKMPVKSAAAKKTAGKKAAAQTVKKSTVKKASAAKVQAKSSPQKKVPAKKAPTKKVSAKKATKPVAKSMVELPPSPGKTSKKSPAVAKSSVKPVATKSVAKNTIVAKNLSGASTEPQAKPKKAATAREDYSKFKTMLYSLRHRLLGDVSMMSQEALGDGASDNHAPIHPAEVGSHSFEQEFTLNLLSTDGDRLAQIEAALEKIADGSYGSCEECGGRIPKARLELIPDVPYCVKCASKLET